MKKILIGTLFLASLSFANETILEKNGVKLSADEITAGFNGLSPAERLAMKKTPVMITTFIEGLVKNKSLATKAMSEMKKLEGFEQQLQLNENKFIADLYIKNKLKTKYNAVNFKTLAKQDYLANKQEYTPKDTYDYYHILLLKENNLSDTDPKMKAEEIIAQIKSGKITIAQAAKDYRMNIAGVDAEGLLLKTRPEDLMEEIKREVVRMKVGDISPIIETGTGYHILSLAKVNKGKVRAYDSELEAFTVKKLEDKFERDFYNEQSKEHRSDEGLIVHGEALEALIEKLTKS